MQSVFDAFKCNRLNSEISSEIFQLDDVKNHITRLNGTSRIETNQLENLRKQARRRDDQESFAQDIFNLETSIRHRHEDIAEANQKRREKEQRINEIHQDMAVARC